MNVKSAFLAWCAASAVLCTSRLFALGPHELVVVANADSDQSVAIARQYMQWRRVPECNLVLVDVPASAVDGIAVSLDTFRSRILDPVRRAVSERGLNDQVHAWVYSVDFPVRVSTPENVSLIGATFLRGELPDPEDILKATYASPLFAGPERTDGSRTSAQSFDRMARMLGNDMPLPSMMLGFTGERGNTLDEVQGALWRGVQSDGTTPTGTVYFVTNDDVRSRCRAWQYEGARRELALEGVHAEVTGVFPAGKRDVIGLMTGSASVNPERVGAFLPGALAEHLTSWGATFDQPGQSKVTLWIRAGATLTAGTVVEPRALYQKFPTARFYYCYAKGCTAIESFFLSIRSPLQVLPLGDPLASPWGADDAVEIVGMPERPVAESFTVTARLKRTDALRFYALIVWLVDGRVAGKGKELSVDVSTVGKGMHTLRAVAYTTGLVRRQVFAVESFEVE